MAKEIAKICDVSVLENGESGLDVCFIPESENGETIVKDKLNIKVPVIAGDSTQQIETKVKSQIIFEFNLWKEAMGFCRRANNF
jgi:folate-dependent phosphoribosylglycinamide formyltransferase PurN